MDGEAVVGFRALTVDDVGLVRRWLGEPHVAEWWGDTADRTDADAASALDAVLRPDERPEDGARHVDPWILLVDGEPVGWLESYRVADWPTYAPGLAVPPGTWALDVAIGEPSALGRGLGPRLLRAFVDAAIRPAVAPGTEVWIDPDPRNVRACRAYAKVGFVDTGVDLPDPDHPDQVRRLHRLVLAPT